MVLPQVAQPLSQPQPACRSTSLHCQLPPGGPRPARGGDRCWCCRECRHQCSQLSAKEGSAGETVSAKPAPTLEGDPTTAAAAAAVCLLWGDPQPSGQGASLCPSVKTSCGKCISTSWPLCLAWLGGQTGRGSPVLGECAGRGITSAHAPHLKTQLSTFSGRHGSEEVDSATSHKNIR